MFKIFFNIDINIDEKIIWVIISLIFFLLQKKKKGDDKPFSFKVGNITLNPTIKLLNFNINSKNKD